MTLTLFTLSYVALAIVHLFAWAAIVARHAVPNAPRTFHWALSVPMLLGVALLFLIAVVVRSRFDSLFGVDVMYYRLAFIWTDVLWLSILLYYSYWWYSRGRNDG